MNWLQIFMRWKIDLCDTRPWETLGISKINLASVDEI